VSSHEDFSVVSLKFEGQIITVPEFNHLLEFLPVCDIVKVINFLSQSNMQDSGSNHMIMKLLLCKKPKKVASPSS
jgi:hypothetical protein